MPNRNLPGKSTLAIPTAFVCVALTLAALLAGCQHQPGEKFATFEEKRQQGYVPPESFPAEVDEDQPIVADVEPDASANLITIDEQPVSALAPVNVVDGSNVADIMKVSRTPNPLAAGPAEPRKISLLVKNREFKLEGPQKALRVNYDDLDLLKILNMDPVTPDATAWFPDWLRGLDGQRVRIRGFMMPTFESTGLERFVLARDAALCCFGPNPKVYDLIAVELKPGITCDYIHLRPFDVIGTLRIDLQSEDNKPLGLYWIEDAEVIK